jgi:hypothetical protein
MITPINGYMFAPTAPAGIQFVGGKVATRKASGSWAIDLTDLTGGLGSAPIEGDYVIVAQNMDGSINYDFVCSTSGFSELEDRYGNGGHDINFGVHAKIMTSSPDTNVTFTGPDTTRGKALVVHVWRGVDPTTPQDVARVYASNLNSGVANPPAITPVTAGAKIVCIGTSSTDISPNTTPLASTLDNFFQTQEAENIFRTKIGIGSHDWNGSGAYDPPVWTGAESDTWAALTMALRPL